MASVVLSIKVSIWWEWDSVSVAMSSSVASAFSWITFDLQCFEISLFCLFSFAYSAEMSVLMFFQVLSAAGICSHSWHAASNLLAALRKYSAMSLHLFRSELIPFLAKPWLKYSYGFLLTFHSPSFSGRSFLVLVKLSAPPMLSKRSSICLGDRFKHPNVLCLISTRYSLSTALRMMSFVPWQTHSKVLNWLISSLCFASALALVPVADLQWVCWVGKVCSAGHVGVRCWFHYDSSMSVVSSSQCHWNAS